MEKLPKIARKSVSDQVFDMLKDYIIQGKFKVGEKIPSENELTKMLGVSRPSIKAAVERLRAMGLIDIRVGDGSYVKQFSTAEYIANFADFIMDEQNISEIVEIRRALELESLSLAIKKAEPDDIEQLKFICDNLVEAFKRKDYAKGASYDYEFHLQICKCSKNKYFPMMYELIGSLIYKQIELFSSNIYKKFASSILIDDHVKMYQAIKEKDFTLCHQLFTNMIDINTHMD